MKAKRRDYGDTLLEVLYTLILQYAVDLLVSSRQSYCKLDAALLNNYDARWRNVVLLERLRRDIEHLSIVEQREVDTAQTGKLLRNDNAEKTRTTSSIARMSRKDESTSRLSLTRRLLYSKINIRFTMDKSYVNGTSPLSAKQRSGWPSSSTTLFREISTRFRLQPLNFYPSHRRGRDNGNHVTEIGNRATLGQFDFDFLCRVFGKHSPEYHS